MRRLSRTVQAALLCGIVAATLVVGTGQAQAATPGPFLTWLFSRTEITGAIDCTPNSVGIARLDTKVAPYLRSLGMTATGTLQTGGTYENTRNCTHYRSSIMASWADARMFSTTYGWRFVSHTARYPADIASLSPQRQWDETCGSAAAIDAHGLLGGHGLIAYPGAGFSPAPTQQAFGQHCFAWGRRYTPNGTTAASAAAAPPYWQGTRGVNGGPCNVTTAACYTVAASGGTRYTLPSSLIANVNALRPGTWATIQVFVLVTGTSPAGSSIRWDCRSDNPALHWTNDNERYCYKDWQAVVRTVANRPAITVTDPLTVGVAWGRPATYSFPRP